MNAAGSEICTSEVFSGSCRKNMSSVEEICNSRTRSTCEKPSPNNNPQHIESHKKPNRNALAGARFYSYPFPESIWNMNYHSLELSEWLLSKTEYWNRWELRNHNSQESLSGNNTHSQHASALSSNTMTDLRSKAWKLIKHYNSRLLAISEPSSA